jgi:hypothetical protein
MGMQEKLAALCGQFLGQGGAGKGLRRGRFYEYFKREPVGISIRVRSAEKRLVEDRRFPQSVEMMERALFQDKRLKIVN